MPIQFIRNDITKIQCDAIVSPSNPTLFASGGVDGAIRQAGGKELNAACLSLGGCAVGQAKITKGYRLPCKYVIHTVGPVWDGGMQGEEALLRSCYRSCLDLAAKYNCDSAAFPLISSGTYGYPKDKALRVATDEISRFLLGHDMLIYLVFFDQTAFSIGEKLYRDITEYIDQNYVDQYDARQSVCFPMTGNARRRQKAADRIEAQSDMVCEAPAPDASFAYGGLDRALQQLDESFSQMLLRKIEEKGMSDPECYKKANVDRKLFSKIRSDVHYKPKKTTAIAFAVALELSAEETEELLRKAGYALSHSNKFDVIIEYFIKSGNYNIFEINEALFSFDQCLLGC